MSLKSPKHVTRSSASSKSAKKSHSESLNEDNELGKDNDIGEVIETLKRVESTVNSMAKQQASMDLKLEALTRRLDEQAIVIKDLEQAAEHVNRDLGNILSENRQLAMKIENQESQMKDCSGRIVSLQDEINNLQRYSRGYNLRFVGLPEEADPTKEDCIKKIQSLIESRLNMEVDLENAHRIGLKTDRPRHIIVKFIRRPERFAVLRQRFLFQEDGIMVFEDLIPSDRLARKNLKGVAQEARNQGKRTKFVKDYLLIDGRRYTPP